MIASTNITAYEFEKLVGAVCSFRIEHRLTRKSLMEDWWKVKSVLNDTDIPMFRQNDGTRLAVVKSQQLRVNGMVGLRYVETPYGAELQAEFVSYRISIRDRVYRFFLNLL